jgi:sugar lactone lactonase YvrE
MQAQATVTTIGGGSATKPYSGFINGNTLTQAKFALPAGLAMDPSGTVLFVADYTNNAIRMVSQAGNTAASVTTTFATSGVSHPLAVVVDGKTNVFVLNHGTGANGSVVRIVGTGGSAGTVTTLASGLVSATALTLDNLDNCYATVSGNKVIRIATNGVVTTIGTVATGGTSLQGIALVASDLIALSDAGNNGILTMNLTNGATANLTGFHGAGDTLGASTTAAFRTPEAIAAAGGNTLVVADNGNDKVKLVDASGNVTLLYGVSSNLWITGSGTFPGWLDGRGTATNGSAEARQPYGVLVASDGSVFVSEDYFDVLRHVTGTGLTPPAPIGSGSGGGGTVPPTTFNGPGGIAYDSIGNSLYVANPPNDTVEQIDLNLTTNATSTVLFSSDGLIDPVSVLVDTNENLYVLNRGTGNNGFVLEFDMFGNAYGPIVTGLNQPTAFAMDGSGNILVAEQAGKICAFGSSVSNTFAIITNANVSLQGIAIFDDGTVAVSDAGNAVIWALDPITRVISKLTGQLGTSGIAVGSTNFAKLNQPHQLAPAGGNQILAADYGNNRVVLVQRTGYVITNTITYHLNSLSATVWFGNSSDPVATNSTRFVPMAEPVGVAVGSDGVVFASEDFYSDVREMTGTAVPSPGAVPTIDFPAFLSLGGVALNSSNTVLYITDPVNNTVSALNLANNQTTVVLDSSSGIYQPVDVALDIDNNLYVLNQGTGGDGSIMSFDQFGYLIATNAASLAMPTAMKMDLVGNIYVSELDGAVQQFSGSTSNTLAVINTNADVQLEGVAVLDNGDVVVSDAGNSVVWAIPPYQTTGEFVLFTGAIGSSGTNFGGVGHAKLNQPRGLAEVAGGQLLIADSGNNRIVLSDDSGTVSAALTSTNADLWFGVPTDPVTAGNANFVAMESPIGLALGTSGTVYDSEAVYRDIRGIMNTGLQPPSRPPPPPAPEIGWFDYEEDDLYTFVTVLHPITISVFHNDQLLAINPMTNGVSTYYIKGLPPLVGSPSATNGTSPPFYQDGITYAEPLEDFGLSNLVIEAVNIDAIGQQSAVTTAEFIFQVASPNIGGFNGAQFTVSDITTNSELYYTIDGSDPTNGPPSIGPISLTGANEATLSIMVNSNVTFKIAGYRDGYLPSGIAEQSFSPSNFVANTISFGFVSGEASSDFVAAPGQTFYAPVTLTTLSKAVMYSLQFNVVVTNAGYSTVTNIPYVTVITNGSSTVTNTGYVTFTNAPNPGPAISPDAFGFQTMLMQPDPANPTLFLPIYPFAYVAPGTNQQPELNSILYNGNWFQSLVTANSQENLLTVGWLERYGQTNLYNTISQNLLTYSMAHDDLFPNDIEPNEVIVGGYSFVVPGTATNGQTYQIQIGRPSATSDGIGAPGSSIYIAAPTNGALAGGAPLNGLKFVTVGQLKYLVGSVYPFRWFNAGDFGSSNIVNADVEQVFQSAIYGLNSPPPGSDFFDAMDSCGATYVDSGNGYLTRGPLVNNTEALFNGNDTSINQIAFGDGVLDVCDVYVTFRRSLDPGLTWFQRYWNSGQRVAQIVPNVFPNVVAKTASVRPKTAAPTSSSSTNAQVNFVAVDTPAFAGQTVQVPITADVFGSYPLRVLMLNLTVTPLDGSPDLTTPVQFVQTASVLGMPLTTTSDGNDNFAAVWLNSTNSGLTGTETIGYLTMTIPATATAMSAYAIHFDHASASPNGLASFPKQTLTGLVTLSSRTNSYYNDGIPDSWRLRWFGTIYNILSISNACPSGDGVDNWEKFVAGVDPNVANDFPSTQPRTPVPAGYATAIHWPSVSGVQYVILRSPSLFNGPWTAITTNTGSGTDMEFDDTDADAVKFYRVEILP